MALQSDEVIAVDAALPLSGDVLERVTRLNTLLYADEPEGFLFGPTVVPHITLAQFYIRRTNLLELIKRLDSILRETSALKLSVAKLASRDRLVALRISRTPELLRLHASIMDEAKSLSEPAGGVECFFGGELPARQKDADYVAAFRKRASYNAYVPHITLGFGQPPVPDVYLDFVCKEAGLFHLGKFCTCRQLLHLWKLH